ncbi:restriction endonuclease subunit S [Stenomitos frigidus]|nr:restriction endonuclease subunit S [Stenomitos frigidus]
MNVETFFENFELLTNASNAVDKLREVVLQLAVRGKLVSQDSEDESASLLLQKVQARKEFLIKEGKIKKIKESKLTIDVDDIIFSLPNGWCWENLSKLVLQIKRGPSLKCNQEGLGIRYITSGNLLNGKLDLSADFKFLDGFDKIYSCRLYPGDVILNCVNSLEKLGKSAVFREEHGDAIVGFNNYALELPKDLIFPDYIQIFFQSFVFKKQLVPLTKEAINQASIATREVNSFILPIPPFAEQKRIVEKCDRLLIVCDEIEKRQQQRQASLLKMNEGAIFQLLTAQTPDDFHHHWQRICNNFDLLYSIPETIPKLRQAILQLAMQGLFVTEKANNEQNALSQPQKVSNFVKVLNGYAFKSEWFLVNGIKLLRNANIGHGFLRWDDTARISPEQASEFQRFKLGEGDIVISLDRPIINTGLKLAKVSKNDLPCLLLQRVGKFEFLTNEVDSDYFFWWLQSPIFINSIDPGRSNGVPHISSKQIEAIPFNPPPLAEQKRIVAKVDSLLSLCDALEAKLKAARDSSTTLMEVAARQILVA